MCVCFIYVGSFCTYTSWLVSLLVCSFVCYRFIYLMCVYIYMCVCVGCFVCFYMEI